MSPLICNASTKENSDKNQFSLDGETKSRDSLKGSRDGFQLDGPKKQLGRAQAVGRASYAVGLGFVSSWEHLKRKLGGPQGTVWMFTEPARNQRNLGGPQPNLLESR